MSSTLSPTETIDHLGFEDRLIPSPDALLRHIATGAPGRVQTLNLHHLQLCESDAHFADVTRSASYVTADGWPIVMLARRRGLQVERTTGSDLVRSLVEAEQLAGRRWALYGGTPTSADHLRKRLEAVGQELTIAETGNYREWDPAVEASKCWEAGVSSVLVAISQPNTEIFGAALAEAQAGLQVIGVGAGVEMLSGEQRRAPRWVQRTNLEWLFRLAQDPRRLFRRYLVDGLQMFAKQLVLAPRRTDARAVVGPACGD